MKTAFTLLELIIVIVIVGILASFAVPQFSRTRENALGREARANLQLIAAAERVYRMERGDWYPPWVGGLTCDNYLPDINANLRLLLSDRNWLYEVCNNGATVTVEAQRQPGFGAFSNCLYRLTNNDADGEPDVVSGPCP